LRMSGSSGLGSVEPVPDGISRGRRPRGDVELDENVGNVSSGGVRADFQFGRDLAIGPAVGDQVKHFQFACGEIDRILLRNRNLGFGSKLTRRLDYLLKRACLSLRICRMKALGAQPILQVSAGSFEPKSLGQRRKEADRFASIRKSRLRDGQLSPCHHDDR
jgi:hypothetical protein